MKRLILIDASGLIYRGFYAIPPFLKSPDGIQTNAVFGFTTILLSMLGTYKPNYIAVAFDKKGPTFRHKEYADYKATRVKAPQELYDQIPLVKEVVYTFGLPAFEVEGFEADDILATIVKKLEHSSDTEILIATGDFDMFQMVSSHALILYPVKGFKDAVVLNASDIEKKYGLRPSQIPDFKGIAGDSSDNLPGVYGIGEKGAIKLLQKYGSLENIYNHINELPPGLIKKLLSSKEDAFSSKKLALLYTDVPFEFELTTCAVHIPMPAVFSLFTKLGFKSLEQRLTSIYTDHIPKVRVGTSPQESLF